MDLDFSIVFKVLPLLLEGAAVTIKITALSVGFGLIIGMVVGIARLAKMSILRWLAMI